MNTKCDETYSAAFILVIELYYDLRTSLASRFCSTSFRENAIGWYCPPNQGLTPSRKWELNGCPDWPGTSIPQQWSISPKSAIKRKGGPTTGRVFRSFQLVNEDQIVVPSPPMGKEPILKIKSNGFCCPRTWLKVNWCIFPHFQPAMVGPSSCFKKSTAAKRQLHTSSLRSPLPKSNQGDSGCSSR